MVCNIISHNPIQIDGPKATAEGIQFLHEVHDKCVFGRLCLSIHTIYKKNYYPNDIWQRE
jgi:hypothetical protein